MMRLLRRLALPFWSVLIAVILWMQVHGQGMGSVRMDVALQVRDVPQGMAIVNDLPEQVSITITGLQTQLNALDVKSLFVAVNAASLRQPGVMNQALDVSGITLPVGLKVVKIQPDVVQLQVDHVVTRSLEVHPTFDLPQGVEARLIAVTPTSLKLIGPEVWLSTLNQIDTSAIRLDKRTGIFDVVAKIMPLGGKGIRVLDNHGEVRVRGELVLMAPTVPEVVNAEEVIRATVSDTAAAATLEPEAEMVAQPVVVSPDDVQEGVDEEKVAQEKAGVVDAASIIDHTDQYTASPSKPTDGLPQPLQDTLKE